METSVQVNGLKLYGYHGVGAQEQRVGNIFVYDVDLSFPWLEAAIKDDVDLTLSYADIVTIIKEVNDTPSRLLENVAYRLMITLQSTFPTITSGSIRVAKLTPPIPSTELSSASISIKW